MVESALIYANHPRLLMAFNRYNTVAEKPDKISAHLKNLAVLKAATLIECEFCMDIGSEYARATGCSDEQLLALPHARESGLFSDEELLVIELAAAASRTPPTVDDQLIAAARERFGDKGTFELCNIIAWENARARLNAALGIGAGGFSENRVCAIPERAARAGDAVQAAPIA